MQGEKRMNDTEKPTLLLLVKLGSIVVHTDELLGPDGRNLDKQIVQGLIADPEVQKWIKAMGPLLPAKR